MQRNTRSLLAVVCAAASLFVAATPAQAWDAQGHRLITLLALDHLNAGLPAFVKDEAFRKTVAENAVEPDRWRAVRIGQLMNLNNPDHYLDIEDLEPHGLSLDTLPPLRYEYVAAVAIAKEKAGSEFKGRPINEARDFAKTDRWPGFAPYSIAENYGKLVASFKTWRMLEKLNEPARAHQVEACKASISVIMGVMSHYVGDVAQPLHTTMHHHGWIGENPENYTTDYGIHAYIDGKILDIHSLNYDALKGSAMPERAVDARDPWKDIIEHLKRSYAQVEPIYKMKKSGDLERDAGKALISERLVDGGAMLAALYNAAWEASEPTEKDLENFIKFDGFEGK
jgi:hypothetical protein